jgi:hypothetical protein
MWHSDGQSLEELFRVLVGNKGKGPLELRSIPGRRLCVPDGCKPKIRKSYASSSTFNR